MTTTSLASRVASIGILAALAAADVAQIVNGDFNGPIAAPWSKLGYWPDATHRDTEPNGNIYCWMVPQPDDSKPLTELSQQFSCGNDSNNSCQITFWYRFTGSVGATKGNLDVTLQGSTAGNTSSTSFAFGGADGGKWHRGEIKAKTCETKTITFSIPRNSNMRVHLDKVVDACVPEPSSVLALATGIAAVVARRKRR